MKEFDPFTTEITQIVREFFVEYPTRDKQLKSHRFLEEHKDRSLHFVLSLLVAISIRSELRVCFFFDNFSSEIQRKYALMPNMSAPASLSCFRYIFYLER